jgi:predicted  nucleic acid-binding Zn-ribbon protein
MNPVVGQWGPVAVIVGGYLLGIYFQNRRIDDLRDSINRRFDDLRELLKSEVKRLDERLDRLESEIKRLDERFDRLEHPIARPS